MRGGWPSSFVSATVAIWISWAVRIVARLFDFPSKPFIFVYSIFNLFILIFFFFFLLFILFFWVLSRFSSLGLFLLFGLVIALLFRPSL